VREWFDVEVWQFFLGGGRGKRGCVIICGRFTKKTVRLKRAVAVFFVAVNFMNLTFGLDV
jgi:hypothetical protein